MINMTKTISTYISTINSLFFQSTLEQTIRQSLLFSDEIIISLSKLTSDGTYNLLDSLHSEYPNIIKTYIYDEDLNLDANQDIYAHIKTFSLRKCTKDYCILQDDDECIHEKYVDYIRQLPDICPDTLAFRFNVIHFYRSYTRYQSAQYWYQKKIYMIKNVPYIKHGRVYTDPDNHVILDDQTNKYMPLDSLSPPKVIDTPVTVFHYGWACRNDAVLLMKKYFQEIQFWGKDYWKTHEFPFKFDDPNTLSEFKDTHPKYMIPIIEQERKFNTRYIKDFSIQNREDLILQKQRNSLNGNQRSLYNKDWR